MHAHGGRIDVSDNPVLLPPHGARSVTITFGFRQCFADRTLPSTGGLINVELRRTRPLAGVVPTMAGPPDGWDDSVIASAAAAAVSKACS